MVYIHGYRHVSVLFFHRSIQYSLKFKFFFSASSVSFGGGGGGGGVVHYSSAVEEKWRITSSES